MTRPEDLFADILFQGAGRDIQKAKSALQRGNLEEFDTLFKRITTQYTTAHSLRHGTRVTKDGLLLEPPVEPRPYVRSLRRSDFTNQGFPEQSDVSLSEIVKKMLEEREGK